MAASAAGSGSDAADAPPTAHPAATAGGQTAAPGAPPPADDDAQPAGSEVADLRRRVETLAAEFRQVALHAAWDQGLDARRGIETDLWQKIQALEDAMSSDQALEEGAEGRRFRADLLQRVKVLDSCLGSLCCHYMQMRG